MTSSTPRAQSTHDSSSCSLIILRHAKSSWSDPSLRDFERPLNRRGERDAPYMAQRICHHGLQIDEILCSSSVRTQLTLNRMEPHLRCSPERVQMLDELYHASLSTLITLLQNQRARALMLIGHNPGVELLVELLSQGTITRFPTCAFAVFSLPFQQWADLTSDPARWTDVQTTCFEFPKMFPHEKR